MKKYFNLSFVFIFSLELICSQPASSLSPSTSITAKKVEAIDVNLDWRVALQAVLAKQKQAETKPVYRIMSNAPLDASLDHLELKINRLILESIKEPTANQPIGKMTENEDILSQIEEEEDLTSEDKEQILKYIENAKAYSVTKNDVIPFIDKVFARQAIAPGPETSTETSMFYAEQNLELERLAKSAPHLFDERVIAHLLKNFHEGKLSYDNFIDLMNIVDVLVRAGLPSITVPEVFFELLTSFKNHFTDETYIRMPQLHMLLNVIDAAIVANPLLKKHPPLRSFFYAEFEDLERLAMAASLTQFESEEFTKPRAVMKKLLAQFPNDTRIQTDSSNPIPHWKQALRQTIEKQKTNNRKPAYRIASNSHLSDAVKHLKSQIDILLLKLAELEGADDFNFLELNFRSIDTFQDATTDYGDINAEDPFQRTLSQVVSLTWTKEGFHSARPDAERESIEQYILQSKKVVLTENYFAALVSLMLNPDPKSISNKKQVEESLRKFTILYPNLVNENIINTVFEFVSSESRTPEDIIRAVETILIFIQNHVPTILTPEVLFEFIRRTESFYLSQPFIVVSGMIDPNETLPPPTIPVTLPFILLEAAMKENPRITRHIPTMEFINRHRYAYMSFARDPKWSFVVSRAEVQHDFLFRSFRDALIVDVGTSSLATEVSI